jgi:hypothetical protein
MMRKEFSTSEKNLFNLNKQIRPELENSGLFYSILKTLLTLGLF